MSSLPPGSRPPLSELFTDTREPAEFQHLFSPIRVGHVTLRNRIVSPPHVGGFGSNGYITDRYMAYHAAKAKGGAALIQCFGSMSVHRTSPITGGMIKNWDDSSLPTFQAFAESIHQHGALVMAQITHYGRRSNAGDSALLSASDVAEHVHRETPHSMDKEQIAEIRRAYASAAFRLKRAGFDGADICGWSVHLLEQFWTPRLNHRSDEYGGSFRNRMRFATEVIEEIRAAVGRDFVLGIRLSGDELIPQGAHLSEAIEIAEYLNSHRFLDYFSISGGTGEVARFAMMEMPFSTAPQGVFAPFAAKIRKVVDVPVIYVGKVVDPRHADALIDQEVCDLVGMGRALIADPELPHKAQEGRLEDVRPCLGMQGCLDQVIRGGSVSCTQNPETGREDELSEVRVAASSKRVVVAGGGPAGLEAARVAALRGHQVVLFEQSFELGGQCALAGHAPLRPGWALSIQWLERQIRKLGVTIRLRTAATAARVLAERPDAVIVATGAVARRAAVPGASLPGVCTVDDLLRGALTSRTNCVVVDGTGQVHAGLAADLLAQLGAHVTVVSSYQTICDAVESPTKEPLYERLFARDVVLTPNVRVVGVAPDGTGRLLRVRTENVYSGRTLDLSAVDLVVFAEGHLAVDHLFKALRDKVAQLYLVGDAMAPRRQQDAMLEAGRAARLI